MNMPPMKGADLVPVVADFKNITSHKLRKSSWMNYIQRGPVTYNTLVFDRNIGDTMSLINYFNPDFFTEQELNNRFGVYPNSYGKHDLVKKNGGNPMMPRILLFPENKQIINQTPVRTIISRKKKCIVLIPGSETPESGD